MTRDEIEQKTKMHRKTVFDAWMKQPTTRLLISMIPAGNHQDILLTLLQDAFDSGFNSGGVALGIEILTEHFDKKGG